jgi:hypothetical protein
MVAMTSCVACIVMVVVAFASEEAYASPPPSVTDPRYVALYGQVDAVYIALVHPLTDAGHLCTGAA